MKNRKHSHRRDLLKQERVATYITAILLTIFVGVCGAILLFPLFRPDIPQSPSLQQLVSTLLPLITLIVKRYLQRNKGGRR